MRQTYTNFKCKYCSSFVSLTGDHTTVMKVNGPEFKAMHTCNKMPDDNIVPFDLVQLTTEPLGPVFQLENIIKEKS